MGDDLDVDKLLEESLNKVIIIIIVVSICMINVEYYLDKFI